VHRLSTSFIFGYHGCDRRIGESILAGQTTLQKSENNYDWLGPGIYFWETNPERALQFAFEKLKRNQDIREPYVVGAVIDLGLCLDLTTKDSLDLLKDAHESLMSTILSDGTDSPVNGPAVWMHYLDCAVITRLHAIVEDSRSPGIDTVRGIFQEGNSIYPGSAFLEKTHIQVAVVSPQCIKAVFRVEQPVIS
jgi:hypothetical protein